MRVWRTSREAGRPFPQLSEDPYIDFCVTEALALKDQHEQIQAQKDAKRQQEIDEWKNNKQGLREKLAAAGLEAN